MEPGETIALVDSLPTDRGEPLTVQISYEIIRLFSEGLYQSPHKAIEELVTNGWDAGARNVHVLLPRMGEDAPPLEDSLWVIDDGSGMTEKAFRLLWRVADSPKENIDIGPAGRPPIGQFGIGKLAAYVLAWRLTHISKSADGYRFTSMDFHDVIGRHQWDPNADPLSVQLAELTESEAMAALGEVRDRDPAAWDRMFGPKASKHWTAAAMSQFKDLFGKLQEGTLGWVLRTGLPLQSDFSIWLNGQALAPSRESIPVIFESAVGGPTDDAAARLNLKVSGTGILIPGIKGEIGGLARLFERPLTTGKAQQYGRSHGFFVRVRGRIINLTDELFGLDALNHAAWARFSMYVDADGLRDHLLSSREGVRESEPIAIIRSYLHLKFNECRKAFERQENDELVGIDIQQLLADAPFQLVRRPLLDAVRSDLDDPGRELYYVRVPQNMDEGDRAQWLAEFEAGIELGPFDRFSVVDQSPYAPAVEYDASTRELTVNQEHPFVSKVLAHSKDQTPAALIGSAEVLTDALLREAGVPTVTALEFLRSRDRALRYLAGGFEPDAKQVLRRLDVAPANKTAFERAVGEAFMVLGFAFQKRGGNMDGPDGVLDAFLGLQDQESANYRVVYDAKTSDQAKIPASKVDLAALWQFRMDEDAQHAFVIGKAFDGDGQNDGSLNRRSVNQALQGMPVTLLRTRDLAQIVRLHFRHGIPLTRLRQLFGCKTTIEASSWVENLTSELEAASAAIPLGRLLAGLEAAKTDALSAPNVHAVRAVDESLKAFDPPRLIAALKAVESLAGREWIEVAPNGDVKLHHGAPAIAEVVEKRLVDLGLGS